MEPSSEPLLIFWRSVGNWGFLLVIIGVAGEVLAGIIETWLCEHFNRHKPGWKLFEIVSGAILIVGLAMEYKGHQRETNILDADNTQSYLESKQAETNAAASYLQAADARKEAGLARLAAANVVSNNLVLSNKLVETELHLLDLRTPMELGEETSFANALKAIPGVQVKLRCILDEKAQETADSFETVFLMSGWSIRGCLGIRNNLLAASPLR